MKLDFRHLCLLGVIVHSSNVVGSAQELGFEPKFEEEVETYIPPPPSAEDLRHYELVRQAKEKWSALFKDPSNASLHLDVARHYNILGNGDIALHELTRAEELGIPREEMLTDIGRAYYHRERYDDILNEITIDTVPADNHGEMYLLRGHAFYNIGNFEEAFLHYYQADQLILDDKLELTQPLAKLYNDIGDYENSELNVDKALSKAPMKVDLLIIKGDLVHRRAGAEQAFQYFEKAHFYEPENHDAQSKYAAALYNLDRFDDMVVVLRRMLAKDQADAFANYMIATNFARGNNIRTATRYLNQAGNAYDNFAPALLLKGKLGYAIGNYSLAEETLRKLIRISPDNNDGRRLLVAALLQQGKSTEAVRAVEYLVQNNMVTDGDYPLIGTAFVMAGDNDRGVEYLNKVVNSNIELLSESQRREVNDFEIGSAAGVSVDLETIINKTGSVSQSGIVDAYTALNKEKYYDALNIAASLINQNRNSPIGYNLLGLIYMQQNKIDEARSNFRRAIQLDRDFHGARINIAKMELMLGNRNDGINYLNQILARNERYMPAYQLLYEVALENDDLIAAERYLSTAATANSAMIDARIKLFDFYIEQNNLARAKVTARRMIEMFPEHAVSYQSMGNVELKQGNLDEAKTAFETSLELDNTIGETYVLLSQVYKDFGMLERARPLLHDGLIFVKETKPLQICLIELAEHDLNFADSQLYVDQLKLDENTKADAFVYEGELMLLQNRGEDAVNALNRAIRAGASEKELIELLDAAELMRSETALQSQSDAE